jgi:hypothetical protein
MFPQYARRAAFWIFTCRIVSSVSLSAQVMMRQTVQAPIGSGSILASVFVPVAQPDATIAIKSALHSLASRKGAGDAL